MRGRIENRPRSVRRGARRRHGGGCPGAARRRAGPAIRFLDVTAARGSISSTRPSPEKKYIVEAVNGGVALFDYDRDGLLDIYLVNSLTVATAGQPSAAPSALYRNLAADGPVRRRGKRRRGRTSRAGGSASASPTSTATACQDLYVTGFEQQPPLPQPRRRDLHRRHRRSAGVAGGGWSAGCGFADFDRDGDLDLFVSRYVEVGLANLPEFGRARPAPIATSRCTAARAACRGSPTSSSATTAAAASPRSARRSASPIRTGYFGLGIAWFDADDGRLARSVRGQRHDPELPLP